VPLVTAADVVYRVLRKCAQLRPGWVSSPELASDVLDEWSTLVSDWNAEPDMTVSVPQFTYAIPPGGGYLANHKDFKIGPAGADITGPRPEKLLKANLLLAGPTLARYPLQILPWREYGDIPVLAIPPTSVTTAVYYQPDYPVGILHFWPPVSGGPSIEFWTYGVLAAPATLATTVVGLFPPGYESAVILNLAARCQYLVTKELGKIDPKIPALALRAKQRIQNVNRSNPTCRSDFQTERGGGGAYDPTVIYTGYPL
jgi:hypothetical protein